MAAIALRVLGAGLLLLSMATLLCQRALPERLDGPADVAQRLVLDRHGAPLNLRHTGGWNVAERLPLEAVPLLLRRAFIEAEDRRFWTHPGVDCRARLSALHGNLRAGRVLRGASTISEQVVRVLHPRPRRLWSRWIEGFEALRLEARFSKAQILEFYLNQVPYGANRRGVLAAARYYFGRSLETLSEREMLALAVLVRAPSRLLQDPPALERALLRLAERLAAVGVLAPARHAALQQQSLPWARAPLAVQASHFVAEALRRGAGSSLRSSLDPQLQANAERYLRERLYGLRAQGVNQGALLIVDLQGNRVRAWASVDIAAPDVVGLDAVQALRQPGSTLKPLLYALALEQGWSADTRIDDSRLTERVNSGLHEYRNYSRSHYGAVTLREALGNSLNIPALKTLQFVGGARLLARLRALGMDGLTRHPDAYGDGLALGNGEVSLYQLVQAYTAIARAGVYQPLTLAEDDAAPRPVRRLIAAPAALAISEMLSDPQARLLEFGDGGLLRFPAQTAVKTGTSSDYRDAWTLAYNGRHVVGCWMGNLSGRETDGITGAQGPALLVRALVAQLARESPAPLLARAADAPVAAVALSAEPPAPARSADTPQLVQPFDGLQLAMDPRIPDALEAFEFVVEWNRPLREVVWYLNGAPLQRTRTGRLLWNLRRGRQSLWAELSTADGGHARTPEVSFRVR